MGILANSPTNWARDTTAQRSDRQNKKNINFGQAL
jgi:hypothetical protein